jgi:tetratricopeptide (TPR) repeat protein
MQFRCCLPAVLLLFAATPAAAQRQPDAESDLIDTTYRLLDNGTAEVLMHQRVRAITAQGRTVVSRIQIPFVPAFEDIEFTSVRTLKKDGSVVNGDPASAFDGAPAGNPLLPMFNDTKLKIVLPPSLDTGDSVEYEAVMRVRKWPKEGDFWFAHYPNRALPVKSETVTLDLPQGRQVAFWENPALKGEQRSDGGRRIYRWTTDNPPGTKPNVDGQPPIFAVSSMTSWDAFGQWMHSLNAHAAEPTPEITALAAKLTEGKTGDAARIAALHEFVATKIRYVAVAFGLGRLQPHNATDVLHNGYGDCKDQTALLSALLTAAGFKAHAVLTTPSAGVRVRDVPMSTQFTHEFTAVQTASGTIFLDPSIGPAPPQVMGPGVRGRTALLIGDAGASVIDIPARGPITTQAEITLKGKIGADGAFDGALKVELRGIHEAPVRRVFLDAAVADKEALLRQFAGPELKNATVRQITSSDAADLTRPFTVECELSAREFYPPNQPSMRITFEVVPPAAQVLAMVSKPQNPLPVDGQVTKHSMDLTVDTSYMISDHPATHRKASFGSFDSEYTYKAGHLMLTRSFELNGTPIAPAEWDKFVEMIRTAQLEAAGGFLLTRHGGVPRVSTTALGRAFEEGNDATRRGDFEAAKKSYLEAVTASPQSWNAWLALGATYARLRDWAKAEESFKKVIQLDPKNGAAYHDLGLVYRATHRDDEAIAQFRKQLEFSPADARIHDNLAVLYAAKNQWEQSRAAAARAAELSPDDPVRWSRLARAQVKLGQTDEAGKTFDRALSLAHSPMTENDVAYYMADAGIQLDRAWKLISGALDPEARAACEPQAMLKDDKCTAQLVRIAHMLDTAAWVLYRQGKAADADPYAAAAYAIQPEAEVTVHRAVLAAKAGRAEEAVRFFAEAQRLASFAAIDAAEARREIAKAAGGDAQLDARLRQVPAPGNGGVKALALVDEKGKVVDADAEAAKSLTLGPIAWPGHALRSVRTVEMGPNGVVRSYVGIRPE